MDETQRNKLWEKYSKDPSSKLREELILEYAPLVKIVAGRLNMYLGYNVEYDDLVSYGIFGLIDAIDKYDYGKGNKFETYASLRIRGEILDQIRKMDWIPRSVRQKQKLLNSAISKIETATGKAATDEEIAKELNISSDELTNWQGQLDVTNVISLDEFIENSGDKDVEPVEASIYDQPEEVVDKAEIKKVLTEALEALTEKERQVIALYYYEEMTLKEISLALEVSESRVSQLHTKALKKMKAKLGPQTGFIFGVL